MGPGEDCDDRNRVNGDGCDAICTDEQYAIITGRAQVRRLRGHQRRLHPTTAPSHVRIATSDGADGCPDDTLLELFDAKQRAHRPGRRQRRGRLLADRSATSPPATTASYRPGAADRRLQPRLRKLYQDASAGGALLAPSWPPATTSTAWTYPRRSSSRRVPAMAPAAAPPATPSCS
ncbi:MAG: hypothetical protein R3F60_33710 [bacterium]